MTEDSIYRFRRDPEPMLNYGNYPRQYLLQVNDTNSSDLKLLMGNAIGRDKDGEPIILDSSEENLYRASFKKSYGSDLEWRGRFEKKKSETRSIFSFFCHDNINFTANQRNC
jgi:hypothetical protein